MEDQQLEELMVQSFIKIMMETEKTAEGKAELAAAQKRDEERRISRAASHGVTVSSATGSGNPPSSQLPQQQQQPQQQQMYQVHPLNNQQPFTPSAPSVTSQTTQQQQYHQQIVPPEQAQRNTTVPSLLSQTTQNEQHQQYTQPPQSQQHVIHGRASQTSIPSLLSQPPASQPQQQHMLHNQQQQLPLPHGVPEQPSYPGVVPASNLVYTTEPHPSEHTGERYNSNHSQHNNNVPSSTYGQLPDNNYTLAYNTGGEIDSMMQLNSLANNNPSALPYPHRHISSHTDNSTFSNSNHTSNTHPNRIAYSGPYSANTNTQAQTFITETNNDVFLERQLRQISQNNQGAYSHSNHELSNAKNETPRTRRYGRDHTHWPSQPLWDHTYSGDGKNSDLVPFTNGQSMSYNGNEGGLQLVELDRSDEENDIDIELLRNVPPNGTSQLAPGKEFGGKSDVYPIDERVLERDIFRQEYTPSKKERTGQTNGKALISKANSPPKPLRRKKELREDNDGFPSSDEDVPELNFSSNGQDINPQHLFGQEALNDNSRSPNLHYGNNHFENHSGRNETSENQNAQPQFAFQVTDFDSALDFHSHNLIPPEDIPISSNGQQILDNPQRDLLPVPSPSRGRGNRQQGNIPPVPEPREETFDMSKPVYAMSQLDYDRFTSVPSEMSTVRDVIDPEDGEDKPKLLDDRTFILHPDLGKMVPGPGYKFLVERGLLEKRASRRQVLTRAEQLLVARKGLNSDRSDSSDETRKRMEEDVDDDDDDNDDELTDLEGPRHRALRRVNRRPRRVYDDSTSSDDVLHTIRYNQRGPLTVAARRARLTSVNARLKKQKRMRASLRPHLPPPRPMDEDEFNSSESDVMGPASSNQDDDERYEETNFQDLRNGNDGYNNNNNYNYSNGVNGGAAQQAGQVYKGKRVWFFRNGDVHYRPKQVLISSRLYQNLEHLLVGLSQIVETSTGVKHVFAWPEGREVKSITDFQNGKYYVCASTCKLQRVDYGNSREGAWKLGKIDRNENFLFQKNGKVQSPLRRPRVLTIISNMYRDSREKLILNTNSQMNFEDILTDIVNMVNIPNPPVRALYTERKPHQKVQSYSQLIRDFADHDNFIACGEEMVPMEMNGTNKHASVPGSMDGSRKRNPRSDIMRIQQDRDISPGRSSDFTTTKSQGPGQPKNSRRRKTDSVRVDINGKTREFFPPTTIDEDEEGGKPDKKLRLDWVYGFRGRDVKQNLAVLPSSGELVYFVAAVVVLYDKKFSSQKHYLGHSEDVTCLAVHPNGRFVATGQNAGKTSDTAAHVRVWDGVSLSTYAVVGLGAFQVGVSCINFSEREAPGYGDQDLASGDLLMAIDESDRHTLTVWEWQTERLAAKTTTTIDPVVAGCFYPIDETILVTYGREHVHFWRLFWDKGRKVMRDRLSGNFEDEVPKFVTSLCFSATGDVITGDSTGAILIWSRDNNNVFSIDEDLSLRTRRAHKKSVAALCMLGDGTLLSGGGNEVKAWDSISNYCLVKERVLPESAGHVRSLVPMTAGGLDGSIFVSTTRNKVLEGSLQLKFKVIIQGHVEELWAVESHPLEQTFVSAGHDQTVVKWSAVSHAPVWRVNVENPCTSISIDPKGRLVALGTTAGKVVILNSYNGIQLTTLLSGGAQVNALSFSPDGKRLAVGTFDGLIQIHDLTDEGQKFFSPETTALKHNSMFIMHMDWSVDSKFIQACLGDYDVIFWDLVAGQKVKANRLVRDVKWATHNSPIGHSVIGPWQNLDRGEVINVVSRSQYRDLTLAGDSRGRARLYRWPCSQIKSGYHHTKVYSSNVTCAAFTCDDAYVIMSGGNDAALMQFSVLDPMST